jgi:hypothetical protein
MSASPGTGSPQMAASRPLALSQLPRDHALDVVLQQSVRAQDELAEHRQQTHVLAGPPGQAVDLVPIQPRDLPAFQLTVRYHLKMTRPDPHPPSGAATDT